jgi:hypothetical protein
VRGLILELSRVWPMLEVKNDFQDALEPLWGSPCDYRRRGRSIDALDSVGPSEASSDAPPAMPLLSRRSWIRWRPADESPQLIQGRPVGPSELVNGTASRWDSGERQVCFPADAAGERNREKRLASPLEVSLDLVRPFFRRPSRSRRSCSSICKPAG